MPTSDAGNLTPIINTVVYLNPSSILDLGIGFGKYGMLCREYLDIAKERIELKDWKVEIHGVEGWYKYCNSIHNDVYDEVTYEDFSDKTYWDKYSGYDLVLMIDSLEHLDKTLGLELLTHLIQSNRGIIVSCPASWYPQKTVNGNVLETHKSQWHLQDFEFMGGKKLYSGVCNVVYFKGKEEK